MSLGSDLLSREMQVIAEYAAKHGTETVLYHNVFSRSVARYEQDGALANKIRQAWSQLPKIDNSWQLFKARYPTPFVQFVETALREQ